MFVGEDHILTRIESSEEERKIIEEEKNNKKNSNSNRWYKNIWIFK